MCLVGRGVHSIEEAFFYKSILQNWCETDFVETISLKLVSKRVARDTRVLILYRQHGLQGCGFGILNGLQGCVN
jgi:hypothetical protein